MSPANENHFINLMARIAAALERASGGTTPEKGKEPIPADAACPQKPACDDVPGAAWSRLCDERTKKLNRAEAALELIAAPIRPDGTYNRCREACEQLARETLIANGHAILGQRSHVPGAAIKSLACGGRESLARSDEPLTPTPATNMVQVEYGICDAMLADQVRIFDKTGREIILWEHQLRDFSDMIAAEADRRSALGHCVQMRPAPSQAQQPKSVSGGSAPEQGGGE